MDGNIHIWLEWSLNWKTQVLSLDWSQLGQLSVDVSQVKLGDSLIKNLWQNVDAYWKLLGLAELNVLLAKGNILRLVQHNLGKNLVGE